MQISSSVCPNCANIVTIGIGESGKNRIECRTCPYTHTIDGTIYARRTFSRVEKDDIFGGPGQWDNAQKAARQCPKEGCDGSEAAFFEVQIRSADEPMTSFFRVGCEGVLFRDWILMGVVHKVWSPVERMRPARYCLRGVRGAF